jgi:hypothetical protein
MPQTPTAFGVAVLVSEVCQDAADKGQAGECRYEAGPGQVLRTGWVAQSEPSIQPVDHWLHFFLICLRTIRWVTSQVTGAQIALESRFGQRL